VAARPETAIAIVVVASMSFLNIVVSLVGVVCSDVAVMTESR
jgi:hypothetical protein